MEQHQQFLLLFYNLFAYILQPYPPDINSQGCYKHGVATAWGHLNLMRRDKLVIQKEFPFKKKSVLHFQYSLWPLATLGVFVKKPNADNKLCIHYHDLNSTTIMTAYPLA